jgi:hypothetical protein
VEGTKRREVKRKEKKLQRDKNPQCGEGQTSGNPKTYKFEKIIYLLVPTNEQIITLIK